MKNWLIVILFAACVALIIQTERAYDRGWNDRKEADYKIAEDENRRWTANYNRCLASRTDERAFIDWMSENVTGVRLKDPSKGVPAVYSRFIKRTD